MTDKQIIIDEEGKGCAFYANGKCLCSDFCLASYCADAPLCIYKQWLRKEQECEELKKNLDFQKNMYECARADEEDKFEEILELKQTLAEIKEIVTTALEQNTLINLDKILQKISECEVENES